LADLFGRDRRPAGLATLIIGPVDLTEASVTLARTLPVVVAEAKAHRDWHRENRRASFVAAGVELISESDPTRCPFCGEPTLSVDRVARLVDASDGAGTPPEDHRTNVRQVVDALRVHGPLNTEGLDALCGSLPEELAEGLRSIEVDQRRLDDRRRRLAGIAEGFLTAIDALRVSRDDGQKPVDDLAAETIEIAGHVARDYASIRATAEAFQLQLTSSLTGLSDDERRRLDGLQRARLLAENAMAIGASWRVQSLKAALRDFIDRLEREEKRRMAVALQVLSADLARYYEELSPGNHIKIRGVSVRDSRFRQASLEAVSFGQAMNPVTSFSEAEGNCLGLSVYFSQRVDRNPQWETILLDDPVQSMDAGHEQGLVQLLARVSRGRQVIVMTHDRRFAEAVEAQFGAVQSFTRYNIEVAEDPQPRVELAAGRLEELLAFAQANANGHRATREAAAGAVRKAVERLTKDLALAKGIRLARKVTIEQAIERVHEAGAVDDIDVGTLHRLRRFGTRSAHDDPLANATSPAIKTGVRALRDLEAKYLGAPKPMQLRLVSGGGGRSEPGIGGQDHGSRKTSA
jgi:hypothetical protein